MKSFIFGLLLTSFALTPIHALTISDARHQLKKRTGQPTAENTLRRKAISAINELANDQDDARRQGHLNHLDDDAITLVSGDSTAQEETCTDLHNKGQYFSTSVTIGTPVTGTADQTFELVADTGSDSVIVTSCVCVKNQMCGATDKCFTGTKQSSSFALKEMAVAHGEERFPGEKAPLGVLMSFGSGNVTTVLSTDVVNVGGTKATMEDGLLLMVDRRNLQVDGTFEGILGLGPPVMKASKMTEEELSKLSEEDRRNEEKKFAVKLFMQKAGVQRYSLCFNDAGKPGTMRMNVPSFKQPLPTMGMFHWGLGLHGISVGNEKADAFACNEELKDGQQTPCGAIPDSGTTLLMGPKDHVVKMFSALCDSWDRCAQALQGEYKGEEKHHAFQKLLYKCGEWKTPDKGIGEVPSLFFNVGEPGNQQKIELPSWSYIVEASQPQAQQNTQYLFGVLPVNIPAPTGQTPTVCYPSLGVQTYDTKKNGPVWILGHPLFYQNTVGYDLTEKNGQMALAITKEECGACSGGKTSLLSNKAAVEPASAKLARPTRVQYHPPRVPQRDTSLPL